MIKCLTSSNTTDKCHLMEQPVKVIDKMLIVWNYTFTEKSRLPLRLPTAIFRLAQWIYWLPRATGQPFISTPVNQVKCIYCILYIVPLINSIELMILIVQSMPNTDFLILALILTRRSSRMTTTTRRSSASDSLFVYQRKFIMFHGYYYL